MHYTDWGGPDVHMKLVITVVAMINLQFTLISSFLIPSKRQRNNSALSC